MEGLQGAPTAGSTGLRIQPARPAKPSKRLLVSGISKGVSRGQLQAELSKYGQVEDIKALRDEGALVVEYTHIDHAELAVKHLNGKWMGNSRIQVDFLKVQSPKQEIPTNLKQHVLEERDRSGVHVFPINSPRMQANVVPQPFTSFPATPSDFQGKPTNFKQQSFEERDRNNLHIFPANPVRMQMNASSQMPRSLPPTPNNIQNLPKSDPGSKQDIPTKVLWIGYPPNTKIDRQGLHNALILSGEIESLKVFESESHALVEFRSIGEAMRAKDAFQGRLLNNPAIQIRYAREAEPLFQVKGSPSSSATFGGTPHQGLSSTDGLQIASGQKFGQLAPNVVHRSPRSNENMKSNAFIHNRSNEEPWFLRPENVHNDTLPSQLGKRPHTSPDPRAIKPVLDTFYSEGFQEKPKKLKFDVDPSSKGSVERGPNIRFGTELVHHAGKHSGISMADKDSFVTKERTSGRHMGIEPRSSREVGNIVPASDDKISGGVMEEGRNMDAKEIYCWHGTIAKGGTPVCRAKCAQSVTGIESKFPEVVDCSAKTSLDMLAKHFDHKNCYGLVHFLPERDEDADAYYELLNIFRFKNQAGVARLSNGVTLFIVPPSFFSKNILGISQSDNLMGILLSFGQQNPSAHNANQTVQNNFTHAQKEQISNAHTTHAQIPSAQHGTNIQRTSLSPQRPPTSGNGAGNDQRNSQRNPVDQYQHNVLLRPELIQALTSIFPENNASNAGGFISPSTSGVDASQNNIQLETARLNQQPQRMISEHIKEDNKHNVFNDQHSFNRTRLPAEHDIIQNSKDLYKHDIKGSNNQFQLDGSHKDKHPWSVMESFNNKGDYSSVFAGQASAQQKTGPLSFQNAAYGESSHRTKLMDEKAEVHSECMNPAQKFQEIGAALLNHGHGITEDDPEKNQRYQSTLQFAASLLLQLQKQQADSIAGNMQNQGTK
eukprot:TRINITY_DN2893_c0_g1_i1.p1 TRINITY_DN2893_c0_g1~~TRINITY_DN2893_c0_g1_i1.p1  ORF type:complete len:1053 (+),score=228.24 TRINITY_DN2893_c0_g1_i1:334-3159(+)